MIQVYLQKRKLRSKRRNGTAQVRYSLRWEDCEGWHCEATGTADKVQAESLRKSKWAELNIPGAAPVPEPTPALPAATWDECRDALRRSMVADNLRASYVDDACLLLRSLERMFPDRKAPAEFTSADANEYKRQRAEIGSSPWTIKGDLSTLKAIFGKWLRKECGLITTNPFAEVKAPRCDDPEIRIVTAREAQALFAWLEARWNGWRLPLVYLDVLAWLGWRATEVASLRSEDLLADGFVRVVATNCKTRKQKHGHLPPALRGELAACAANGQAFGRFSPELQRHLILVRKQPHAAARVKGFDPDRLVGWMQDELQRFNEDAAKAAVEAGGTWEPFTLHDYRRTAITAMQESGATEKETGIAVGATAEVMRKHYEKLNQQAIAKRLTDRRLGSAETLPFSLRAGCAQGIDKDSQSTQTVAS